MFCWLLKNGLAGFTILSLIWGVACIVYDIIIEATFGTRDTISWQTQQASLANPVIPCAVGFVVGGLACHFFRVRALSWDNANQPWIYYALGFAAGVILVAFVWTQRG